MPTLPVAPPIWRRIMVYTAPSHRHGKSRGRRAVAAEVAAARKSTPDRCRNQMRLSGARTGRVYAALPSSRKEMRVSETRTSVSDAPPFASTSFMNAAYDSSTGRGAPDERRMPCMMISIMTKRTGRTGRNLTRSTTQRRVHCGSGLGEPSASLGRSFCRSRCSGLSGGPNLSLAHTMGGTRNGRNGVARGAPCIAARSGALVGSNAPAWLQASRRSAARAYAIFFFAFLQLGGSRSPRCVLGHQYCNTAR